MMIHRHARNMILPRTVWITARPCFIKRRTFAALAQPARFEKPTPNADIPLCHDSVRVPRDTTKQSIAEEQGLAFFLQMAKRHVPDFEFFRLPMGSTMQFVMKKKEDDDHCWAGLSLHSTLIHESRRTGNRGPGFKFSLSRSTSSTRLGAVGSTTSAAARPPIAHWFCHPTRNVVWVMKSAELSLLEQVQDQVRPTLRFFEASSVSPDDALSQIVGLYEMERTVETSDKLLHPIADWLVYSASSHERHIRARRLLGQLFRIPVFKTLTFPHLVYGTGHHNVCFRGRKIFWRVKPTINTRNCQNSTINMRTRNDNDFIGRRTTLVFPPSRPLAVDDSFDYCLVLIPRQHDLDSLWRIGILSKDDLHNMGVISGPRGPGAGGVYVRSDGDLKGTKLAEYQDHFIDVDASHEEMLEFLDRMIPPLDE